MSTKTSSLNVAAGATLLAFLFQLGGLLSPLWYYISRTNSKVFVGLWYVVSCPEGESCTVAAHGVNNWDVQASSTSSTGATDNTNNIWFLIVGSVMAVAVGFECICVLIQICCCCNRDNAGRGGYIACTILLMLAFLLTLGILILFAVVYLFLFSLTFGTLDFPWSALMCGVGGLFALVAFISLCVALCSWEQYNQQPFVYSREEVPMQYKGPQQGYENPNMKQPQYNYNYNQASAPY